MQSLSVAWPRLSEKERPDSTSCLAGTTLPPVNGQLRGRVNLGRHLGMDSRQEPGSPGHGPSTRLHREETTGARRRPAQQDPGYLQSSGTWTCLEVPSCGAEPAPAQPTAQGRRLQPPTTQGVLGQRGAEVPRPPAAASNSKLNSL